MVRLFALTVLFLCHCEGSKILAVFPFASRSHNSIGQSVLMALHDAGHNVTMISPYKSNVISDRYRDIIIDSYLNVMKIDGKIFHPFEFSELSLIAALFWHYDTGAYHVERLMTDEIVKNLINSNETFDAVIVEVFAFDALLGLGQHFNCPVIPTNHYDPLYWNNFFAGNDAPQSYVPNNNLGFTDRMSFTQRLFNVIFSEIEKVTFNLYHIRKQRELYEKYFPLAKIPFYKAQKSASIIFLNSHVSATYARPMQPNMISIGGIHVKPPKQLPENMQKFLDSATDGAILFSMGSFLQSRDWSIKERETFVKTFGKLKQKVLWKFENDTLLGKPDNVMTSAWIPQRDILAHPNVRLFITHGGNLGTIEGLYEGVPMLGLPMYADQQMNIGRASSKGYAMAMKRDEITETQLEKAIMELLDNPKYKKNAERISNLYKDRPMDPQKTVVYWTEYVIRHNGADHLRAASNQLGFIQLHLIDVYATLILGLFATIWMLWKILQAASALRSRFSVPTKIKIN